MWTSTFLGLFTPLTALLMHILAYRLRPSLISYPRQKLAVLVIGGAVAVTTGAAVYFALPAAHIFHTLMLSAMFGYSYFHFFNMSETARRIRILVEYVAGIPHHSSDYDAGKMLSNRLTRMFDHGLIAEIDGKLLAKNGPVLWASYLIVFWRKLFFSKT